MTSITRSPLLVEHAGSVLILRLNRPGKLNALNNTLISALSTTLKNYELDDTVRCVIITGAGRAFSAGICYLAYICFHYLSTSDLIYSRRGHRRVPATHTCRS